MKASKDDKCVIKVEFGLSVKTVNITADRCMQHSGAASGWEGDRFQRVKKAALNR